MLKFLLDEDLPRSSAQPIRKLSHEVLDVRDCGLRGKSDDEVFEFAQKEGAIIFTADLGFGNLLRYPVGSHNGIVIVHLPNELSSAEVNRQIGIMFEQLTRPRRKAPSFRTGI